MDIDLNDAGIGGDGEALQPAVGGRLIALQEDFPPEFFGRRLDRGGEVEPILGLIERWEEDMDMTAARFDRHGGAHQARLLATEFRTIAVPVAILMDEAARAGLPVAIAGPVTAAIGPKTLAETLAEAGSANA